MVQWVVFYTGIEPGRVHELQREKRLRASAEFSTGRDAMGLLPSRKPVRKPLPKAQRPAASTTTAKKGK